MVEQATLGRCSVRPTPYFIITLFNKSITIVNMSMILMRDDDFVSRLPRSLT
jgi:hypothetical protein